jgi:hypothetical protein
MFPLSIFWHGDYFWISNQHENNKNFIEAHLGFLIGTQFFTETFNEHSSNFHFINGRFSCFRYKAYIHFPRLALWEKKSCGGGHFGFMRNLF